MRALFDTVNKSIHLYSTITINDAACGNFLEYGYDSCRPLNMVYPITARIVCVAGWCDIIGTGQRANTIIQDRQNNGKQEPTGYITITVSPKYQNGRLPGRFSFIYYCKWSSPGTEYICDTSAFSFTPGEGMLHNRCRSASHLMMMLSIPDANAFCYPLQITSGGSENHLQTLAELFLQGIKRQFTPDISKPAPENIFTVFLYPICS